MRLLFVSVLAICVTTNSVATVADTIDYWTVRINGRTIINSNINAIIYDNPLMVELSAFADNDRIEICYWTDHGSEREAWHYVFKDSTNFLVQAFANSVDSALDQKRLFLRKNYIAFQVGYLRQLLKERNIKQIFVQFEFDNSREQNPYRGKNICIISN